MCVLSCSTGVHGQCTVVFGEERLNAPNMGDCHAHEGRAGCHALLKAGIHKLIDADEWVQ